MDSNLNKKKIIIVVCMTAVLVWAMPLVVHSLTKDKEEIKSISNKSTIIIDRKEIITYTKFTDRVDLANSNGITLEEANQIKDNFNDNRLNLIAIDRNKKVADRLAEEKRIAEEKAKKAAEEKARLAKIAEEKRQLELAQAAEKKRLAELEAKRVAKNKAKEESKKVTISRGNNEANVSEAYYEVTAYTAGTESTGKSKGDKNYGLTASGKMVQSGVTLACPKSIPFGTKIDIEGFGVRVCLDRGAHIVNGRLDIYMENLDSALSFGRQTLRVKILK